jgi:hypothetical protein
MEYYAASTGKQATILPVLMCSMSVHYIIQTH